MPRYMVERYLPGLTPEMLRAAATRAKHATAEMTQEGTPVRYLRSTFVPSEAKVFCLFEGSSPEVIKEANDRAQIPFERIHDAIYVLAEELS